MHRRDYILIAKVLREAKKEAKQSTVQVENLNVAEAHIDLLISNFCTALKAEASSFNETKFRSYIEKGE
jgi:hypothetical protein